MKDDMSCMEFVGIIIIIFVGCLIWQLLPFICLLFWASCFIICIIGACTYIFNKIKKQKKKDKLSDYL